MSVNVYDKSSGKLRVIAKCSGSGQAGWVGTLAEYEAAKDTIEDGTAVFITDDYDEVHKKIKSWTGTRAEYEALDRSEWDDKVIVNITDDYAERTLNTVQDCIESADPSDVAGASVIKELSSDLNSYRGTITANTDLDNLQNNGTYRSESVAITSTLSHKPTSLTSGFNLTVFSCDKRLISDSYYQGYQIIVDTNNTMWHRVRSADGWSSWKKVTATTD